MPFLSPLDPGIEISIASAGMSKGISQTDGVQVVARGELSVGKIYVGTLAKNLDSPNTEGEIQLLAGSRFKAWQADIAVSIAYKRWFNTTGNPDADAAELNVSVSRTFGDFKPRAQLIYSPDDVGSPRYSLYGEAGIGWNPMKNLTISANLGRRFRGNGPDYASGNIGISYALHRNFTAEVRLFDTNKSDVDEPYKRRLVAVLHAKF